MKTMRNSKVVINPTAMPKTVMFNIKKPKPKKYILFNKKGKS